MRASASLAANGSEVFPSLSARGRILRTDQESELEVSKMQVDQLKDELESDGISTEQLFTKSALVDAVLRNRLQPSTMAGKHISHTRANPIKKEPEASTRRFAPESQSKGYECDSLSGSAESRFGRVLPVGRNERGLGAGSRRSDRFLTSHPSELDTSPCPWSCFGSKQTLSAIVIGETGAGKSTFINTVTNFFKGGTLDKLKIAIPTKYHKQTESGFEHTELNVADRSQSSTDNCTTYSFVEASSGRKLASSGRKFEIIDTPGLADTRGAEQDSQNIEKILKAAQEAHSLSAILLVVNGANPRYTQASDHLRERKRPTDKTLSVQAIQGCMVRLSNFLPDAFRNNILVVFTHCADKIRCIYDKDKLPFAPICESNMLYMENSFFVASPEEIQGASSDTRQLFEFEWDRSMRVMQKMVSRITELDTALTEPLGQVRKSRDELAASLCDMRLQLKQLQDAQTQLDEVEKAMLATKADQSQFAAYTRTKTTSERKMVDVPYHSTICGTCNVVCHDHCRLEEIGQKGSHQFTQCYAFRGASKCNACPGGCSYTDHFHARKQFVDEQKTLEEVIQDIKAKYDLAVSTYSQAASQQGGLASARQAVEAGIAALVDNVQQACRNIKRHCSNFNLAAELAVTIRQLEAERDLLDNLKAIETAEKFIATVKGIVDALSARGSDAGVYAGAKGRQWAAEPPDSDASKRAKR